MILLNLFVSPYKSNTYLDLFDSAFAASSLDILLYSSMVDFIYSFWWYIKIFLHSSKVGLFVVLLNVDNALSLAVFEEVQKIIAEVDTAKDFQ